MGNGAQISVTKDPWLPTGDACIINYNLGATYDNITVLSLMTPGRLKQLDKDLIADLCSSIDTELILNIPLSYRCIEDEWYWMEEEKCMYTVKSGHRTQHLLPDEQRSQLWAMVWNLLIPPKSCNFMWRMLRGILPTTDKLWSRMVQVPTLCPICANERDHPPSDFPLHLSYGVPLALNPLPNYWKV